MTGNEQNDASASKSSLGHKTAVAFSWGVFANLLKIALTLVVQGAMARFLGPSAFGLFAMGIMVMGLASYFADMGISTRLVQQQTIDNDDIAFALGINLMMSGLIAFGVVAGSDYLALFFGAPEASLIFKTMAPVFVINSVASVSVSLLRRNLDYRTIQLANLGGYVVGFAIVGMLCAIFLASAYALVAAYLTQALVNFLMLYRNTRHAFRLDFSFRKRGEHLAFGGTVLATNLINWCGGSIDKLIVGRTFNIQSLGHYSAAYNLIFAPIGALYQNLQSTVFSSMARMDADKPRMREAYLELVRAISLLVLPAFVCAYMLAHPLVLVVYGAQWSASGAFAQVFCLMAPLQLLWGISTPVLWNTGRKSVEASVQIPFILLSAVSMGLAAKHSSLAVAQVAAVAFCLRTVTIMMLACQTLQIGARQFALAILPALVLSACTGVVAWLVETQLAALHVLALLRLVIGGLVFAGTMVLAVLMVPSLIPRTLAAILQRLSARAPQWAHPILKRMNSGQT